MIMFGVGYEQLKTLKFPSRFQVLGVPLLYFLLGQKQLKYKQVCPLAIWFQKSLIFCFMK